MSYRPECIDVPRMLALLGIEARADGGELVARCPYHAPDEHPSWRIIDAPGSKRNGLHWCFSCSSGGSAIDLAQHRLGFVSPAAAVEWLLERASRESAPSLALVIKIADAAAPAFELPIGCCFDPLSSWPTPLRRYAESRGLTAEQVFRWGIGYAVEGRLKDRVVIPIRDSVGKVRSFVARSAVGARLRYLTPSRDERPSPGAIFGEEHWPDAAASPLVVCEGALNALACERVGASAVAALGGSDPHPVQLGKVAARFSRVVLLTDPDPAGEKARASLVGALARHVEVEHLRLPRREDPCSVAPLVLRSILATMLGSGGLGAA